MNFIDKHFLMLKYMICFLILLSLTPCFSETKNLSEVKDSSESKTELPSSIYTNEDSINKKQRIREALYHLKIEEQNGNMHKDLSEKERGEILRNKNEETHKRWEVIFSDQKYNKYVKNLFRTKIFSLWMTQSPELLFYANQFGNIEMVEFFSKPVGIFNLFKKKYGYLPQSFVIAAQDKKKKIPELLHHLKKEEQREEQQREEQVRNMYKDLSEEKRREIWNSKNKVAQQKWEVILADPEYNDYVKNLFQSKDFAVWMTQSPEPLFYAIQFGNIEMVEFFSQPVGIFNLFMKKYRYLPWGFASNIQNIEVIKFYLDNYLMNVAMKDEQLLNIFHYPFFGTNVKEKKHKIIKLLFEDRYFSKNFPLIK